MNFPNDVMEIINGISPNTDLTSVKISRLGKKLDNSKVRPVKVTLNAHSDIGEVLRNAYKLKNRSNYKSV